MVKLIIKQPGYTLTINGKTFRTPAILDVPEIKINNIVSELKRYGVDKYEIVAEPEVLQKKKMNVEVDKVEFDKSTISQTSPVISDKKVLKTLSNIEQILKAINEKQFVTQVIDKDGTVITKKKDDIDKGEEFIPEIKIEELEMKGSSVKTESQDTTALETASEMLSKLIDDDKGE